MSIKIFTVFHYQSVDGQVDVNPFNKAYKTLEAAKQAVQETFIELYPDHYEDDYILEWVSEFQARCPHADGDEEFFNITYTELV